MSVTRVKTSAGWVDLQTVGPPGPSGPTGPTGSPGSVEVYEQPGAPSSPNVGALWVDTDESPGIITYQQITYGTTFPPSPASGDMHVYPGDNVRSALGGAALSVLGAGTGVSWQFMFYVDHWRCVGGPPLIQVQPASITGSSTAYSTAADAISLEFPFKGVWDCQGTAQIFDQSGGGFNGVHWGWRVGTGTEVDAFLGWGGNQYAVLSTPRSRQTVASVANLLGERHHVTAGSMTFANRRVLAWPVRYTP